MINRTRIPALLAFAGVTACSGGSPSTTPSVLSGAANTSHGSGGTAGTTGSAPAHPVNVTTTARFTITIPSGSAATSAVTRKPAYVSSATQSAVITLESVNGTPYIGSAGTIATNLTISSPNCSGVPLMCTAAAPAAPGTDIFLIATYDAQQASTTPSTPAGNLLSTAKLTVAVAANVANTVTTPLILDGVPASIAVSGLPSATAGVTLAAAQFVVAVKDAGNNTIVGTYANPVTLSNSDTSGATTLTTSGTDTPPAGELISSSDTATLAYNGLAILPATIAAAATGVTAGNAMFAPTLSPIGPVTLGGGVAVNAYGSASPVTFTATEAGWSDHAQSFSTTLTGCTSLATVSPASGTTFSATLVASPTPGSCTLTLQDGVGQRLVIPLGYAQFGYSASPQNFTVPDSITQLFITAAGAQGGSTSGGAGGQGGRIAALQPTVSPTVLTIATGQAGQYNSALNIGSSGGSNGGGNGGNSNAYGNGGAGGGGATTVLAGQIRLIVAGGGGGGSDSTGGGNGGGPAASSGGGSFDPFSSDGGGGGGGTLAAGGFPGMQGPGASQVVAAAGSSGTGGHGGTAGGLGLGGGGGGGGYYGGGGGGGSYTGYAGGGGGGGSSYSSASAISNTTGGNVGNGSVTITW